MRNAAFPLNAETPELKEKLRANIFLAALAMVLGATLGAVFFYAGLQKHLAPYQFAEAVMAYQLMPESFTAIVAAVLPWVELTAGLFLVLGYLAEALGRTALALGISAGALLTGGIKRRSCLLLTAMLALLFMVVMLITLARGLQIDCGCGLFFQRQVGAAAILENLGMAAAAGVLYWWEYTGE